MPFRKSSLMDSTGVGGMAEAWGKIVARRVYEQVGPDLDLDADDIEQIAINAACAVAKGTIEELLEKKGSSGISARRAHTDVSPCMRMNWQFILPVRTSSHGSPESSA